MSGLITDQETHTGLFEEIMEWGEDKEDIINWAWQSSGGWEGWAQVELHFLFSESTREDRVYRTSNNENPSRADLAFTGGANLMGSSVSELVKERVIFELKCEGAKNRAGFKAGVKQDLIKIKREFMEEWWKEGSCSVYSIALSMSGPGSHDLLDLGMGEFISTRGHNPPFRLWWAMRYIFADHYSNPRLTKEQAKAFTEKDRRSLPAGPLDYDPSPSDPESPVSDRQAVPEASNYYDEADPEAPNEYDQAHSGAMPGYDQAEVGDPHPYDQDDHHSAGVDEDESMSEDDSQEEEGDEENVDDDDSMAEDETNEDRDYPENYAAVEDEEVSEED